MSLTVSAVREAARDVLDEAGVVSGQWVDTQLNYLIYQGQVELAMLGVIQDRVTMVTVATGVQTLSIPVNVLRINRLACNGGKMQRIDERQMDILTYNSGLGGSFPMNSVPTYYTVYGISGQNSYIDLYPIPDTSYPVMGWFDKLPSIPAASYISGTLLEVPDEYGHYIEHFVLARSFEKEINGECLQRAQMHQGIWQQCKDNVQRMEGLRKAADRFYVVKDIDDYNYTAFGMV